MERIRIEKEKRVICMKRSILAMIITLIVSFAVFILWIILDVAGARNPANCLRSVGLQDGDFGNSFSGWTLACLECSGDMYLY